MLCLQALLLVRACHNHGCCCLSSLLGALISTLSAVHPSHHAGTCLSRGICTCAASSRVPQHCPAGCLDHPVFLTCTSWQALLLLGMNSLSALPQAVLYSFRQACVGMVDHHTLVQGFWDWYWKEKRERGYVPGNWKW